MIQSDIFDHLMAILAEFGLKIYQAPSGSDLQAMFQQNHVVNHNQHLSS